ncbi:MAG: gamma-glutamylcyclotransferase family protein [Candidatus Binatia bacterium]
MYYFAYGSNMDWPQMQRRCPSSKFICVARLADYEFAIARHSRLRQCGTANIFAHRGSEVWGIVYDVADQDLVILDSFEDGYRRETVLVHSAAGAENPIEVIVYIADKEEQVPLPNREYKQLIIQGARYWKVPELYCLMLEQIQAATE